MIVELRLRKLVEGRKEGGRGKEGRKEGKR